MPKYAEYNLEDTHLWLGRGLPGQINPIRTDRSQAFHDLINAADPEMKYAFTPEAARKFLERRKKKTSRDNTS
jgi:hypothetical protein